MSSGPWRLREARPEDAPALLEIYGPIVEQTAISFELEVPAVGEIRRRLEIALADFGAFVALRENRVVGFAWATTFRAREAYDQTCETSVYVAESARGGGVARLVMGELLVRLADRGFHRAVAGIALPNTPSVALHESLGFRPVGVLPEVGFKFGRWHDLGLWIRAVGEGG